MSRGKCSAVQIRDCDFRASIFSVKLEDILPKPANVNVKKIEIGKCQLLLTVSPVYMTFRELSSHALKKYFFLR